MKSIFKIGICFLLGVNLSCIEDVSPDLDRFVKIVGEEQASTGRKVIELSNGDLMLLGEIGEPAFDFNNQGAGFTSDKITEEAPGLAITDRNGNLKAMRSYPLSSFDFGSSFQVFNFEGETIFLDALEQADGSFYLIGESRNVDVYWGAVDSTFTSTVDNNITAPFLMKLSSELDVELLHFFNGGPDWDENYHASPHIKRAPNGDVALLIGFFVEQQVIPTGYTIQLFNEYNSVTSQDFIRNDALRFARNFDFNNFGETVLIGQRNDRIVVYQVQPDDPSSEVHFDLAGDGQHGINSNPMYIIALEEGGYAVIYTDPVAEVIYQYLDANFNKGNQIDITGASADEYPRAFIRMSNGDFIVYTEKLTQNDVSTQGYLYRITINGNQVFRILIDGTPGDVIEASDGTLMVLSNPVYNEVFPKMTLTKLSADGTLN